MAIFLLKFLIQGPLDHTNPASSKRMGRNSERKWVMPQSSVLVRLLAPKLSTAFFKLMPSPTIRDLFLLFLGSVRLDEYLGFNAWNTGVGGSFFILTRDYIRPSKIKARKCYSKPSVMYRLVSHLRLATLVFYIGILLLAVARSTASLTSRYHICTLHKVLGISTLRRDPHIFPLYVNVRVDLFTAVIDLTIQTMELSKYASLPPATFEQIDDSRNPAAALVAGSQFWIKSLSTAFLV
ncbi:SH3 domain-containing protein [Histoplasma capsulatum G186AR]|uniref:SH3 domain-containing protein n=1 Tax=Ajellomyces capsulatus TaxID=5037 RepID=A0A8H7YF34_AJECA|nr:SH3 domain-containing protein [Histoplasma capsulatum]QSS71235.1 SH3 domain-containing protein [Histoplasma capsulatum G186AR]